jgi:hypothetical protein
MTQIMNLGNFIKELNSQPTPEYIPKGRINNEIVTITDWGTWLQRHDPKLLRSMYREYLMDWKCVAKHNVYKGRVNTLLHELDTGFPCGRRGKKQQ